MKELIERLEKAAGPDRNLDIAIFRATTKWAEIEARAGWFRLPNGGEGKETYWAERYTSSIDAAVTLVPEDCVWSIDSWGDAMVAREQRTDGYGEYAIVGQCPQTFDGSPKRKPALALCIALLKARIAVSSTDLTDAG